MSPLPCRGDLAALGVVGVDGYLSLAGLRKHLHEPSTAPWPPRWALVAAWPDVVRRSVAARASTTGGWRS